MRLQALPRLLAAALALAGAPLADAQESTRPPVFGHVPVSEVILGTPLTIELTVDEPWQLASLTLFLRAPGGGWRELPFGRTPQGTHAAIVPAEELSPPRVEYYVVAKPQKGAVVAVFASAAAPHPVLVIPPDDAVAHRERLLRHRGHASRARATGEWVSFGNHGRLADSTGDRGGYADSYYRLEAEYLYRILGAISYIRLGVVSMRGEVPPPAAFEGSGRVTCLVADCRAVEQRKTGMDYGFAEVSLSGRDDVGVQGRLILGADDIGFATGIAGSLRLGEPIGSRFEVGVQAIKRVGWDAWARFDWATVPRFPMAVELHVTNTPAATLRPGYPPTASSSERIDEGAPAGVRAVYELGWEVTGNATLLARVGYQARTATAGGPSLGAGLSVEW